MKALVVSSPRSGTHFVVRSLGLSLQAPVAVKPYIEKLPTTDRWVIGTHNINLLNHCPDDVVKVGIHREMLGHLLSYFDHPENPNTDAFIETVRQSDFFTSRTQFLNLDVNYLSYDKMAKRDDTELQRMSSLFGVPIKLASHSSVVQAVSSVVFRHGDADRWQKVFDKKTQKAFVELDSHNQTNNLRVKGKQPWHTQPA